MWSTTIELAPHQRAAVERALTLLDRRGGVILADEVGLGKSYVAAAVAAALQERMAIDVIVPAGLMAQWKQTLDDFAVRARLTSHDRILSERFVPQAEANRLIIVDEAHAFRNPRTQRYDALARRSVAAHLLLVTATPICNSPDDLHALLSLVACDDALRAEGVASIDDAFRSRDAAQIAIILRELIIRRGREIVDASLQFGALQRQIVWHEPFDASIDQLRFPLIGGHAALLRNVLWRRLESSEAALLESLRRQTRFYQRALDCLASGRTLTKRDYRAAFGDEDNDALQEVLFWEIFASNEARADAEEIRAELARLDFLRRQADAAPRSKASMLAAICQSTAEPALVFTTAIATAKDIIASVTPVRRAGLVTSRGAFPADAIGAFRRGELDMLICTDLAAEGLNLQRAGVVVHYDLPWNPVKLDQRNGRALRIGQSRDVVRSIYFLPRGRHTRIVQAVASKNRARRRLLECRTGFSPSESSESAPACLLALPQHLPRSSPAVALIGALRRRGLLPPEAIARRYRAGMERLFGEMSREYLDPKRVLDLIALVERERIIAAGEPGESAHRR